MDITLLSDANMYFIWGADNILPFSIYFDFLLKYSFIVIFISEKAIAKKNFMGQNGVCDFFYFLHYFDFLCFRYQAWGCGGEEVKAAQQKQKQWEAKDTERQRMRKVLWEISQIPITEKLCIYHNGFYSHSHSNP